jgi:adenylate kinase
MNLLIMGAAGSGKGTMAEKIIETYHIPHISTGSMFRAQISAQSPLGLIAQAYINDGHLVPDDVTIEMVRERLLEPDCQRGYLLDGFPRTQAQAQAFEEITAQIKRPVQAIFNLRVQLDDLADRILGRRMCDKCGSIYHIRSKPTRVENICDICGEGLVQRSDDTLDQLATRLREHVTMTQPVLAYFETKGIVHHIDASQPIEKVFSDINRILKDLA